MKLRKVYMLLVLVWLAASQAPLPALAQPDNTLLSLVKTTLHNYSGIKAAEFDRRATHKIVDIRRGPLLPNISLDSRIGRQETHRRGIFSRKNEDDVNSFSINLRQPLLAMPLFLSYRSAEKAASAANADYETLRQQVILETVQAFLSWHMTSDRLALLMKRQEHVQSQLKATRQLAEEGVGNHADVLLVEAQLGQVKNLIETAKQQVMAAKDTLWRLSGLSLDRLPGLSDDFLPSKPLRLQEWTGSAMKHNSQIIAATERVEETRLLLKAAHAAHQPVINLSAQKKLEDGSDESFYGLEVQIPLLSGFQTSAEAQRAALLHQAALSRLRELQARMNEFIRTQHGMVTAHVHRAKTAHNTVLLRTGYLNKITEAWYEGFASTTDVLNADEELFNAQVELRNTHYGYFSALLQLHSAAGTLNETSLGDISDQFKA